MLAIALHNTMRYQLLAEKPLFSRRRQID
jgi:hypothetical protein